MIMFSEELTLQLSSVKLIADLVIPDNAEGLVIFSHGSGSSRLSTRNRFVADIIQDRGMATLLVDLLTPEEDSIVENRFDIDLLTGRLVQVTEWALKYPKTKELEILYFGASTGAASALRAAAYFGNKISAVVSRGGRPDLAMEILPIVKAPTLLIVGSLDRHVMEMNRQAFTYLHCEKELTIITGASHLFEEPCMLENVAFHASDWYEKHLTKIYSS